MRGVEESYIKHSARGLLKDSRPFEWLLSMPQMSLLQRIGLGGGLLGQGWGLAGGVRSNMRPGVPHVLCMVLAYVAKVFFVKARRLVVPFWKKGPSSFYPRTSYSVREGMPST